MEIEGVIAIFGTLFVSPIAIVIMIIYLRRYSNMERMKAIESGADLSKLKVQGSDGRFMTLRIALLLMGIGLGFLFGAILNSTLGLEEVGYFASLFIFGGAGLGLAYMLESKRKENA